MAAKRREKPRMGRPPKSDARMGIPILVRVSATERATLQAAADRAGKPLSSWIRDTALSSAKEE